MLLLLAASQSLSSGRQTQSLGRFAAVDQGSFLLCRSRRAAHVDRQFFLCRSHNLCGSVDRPAWRQVCVSHCGRNLVCIYRPMRIHHRIFAVGIPPAPWLVLASSQISPPDLKSSNRRSTRQSAVLPSLPVFRHEDRPCCRHSVVSISTQRVRPAFRVLCDWTSWSYLGCSLAPVYRAPEADTVAAAAAQKPSNVRWTTLLKVRSVWGMVLGQAGYLYVYYVFASWLPGYLTLRYDFTIMHTGILSMLPFIAGIAFTLFGGSGAADRCIASGYSVSIVRKSFAVGGMLGATFFTVVAAFALHAWIAIAAFTLAVSSISMTTSSANAMSIDIAPAHLVSSCVSIQNFGGNIGGALAPLVTGALVVNRRLCRAAAVCRVYRTCFRMRGFRSSGPSTRPRDR